MKVLLLALIPRLKMPKLMISRNALHINRVEKHVNHASLREQVIKRKNEQPEMAIKRKELKQWTLEKC